MKRILAVILATIILLLFFFLISIREIKYYTKQSFYSNAIVIIDSFEYEVLTGRYIPRDNMGYIMLNDMEFNISNTTFYLEKSYIAFKKVDNNVVYYLTLIGKGRYASFAYLNTDSKKLNDFSNIVSGRRVKTKDLLKKIKAKEYSI